MAFTARLQFGDNNGRKYGGAEYMVSDYKCHTMRGHNGLRPDADATCESIELTVIAPERGDMILYEWYKSGEMRNGRILIELSSEIVSEDNICKEVLFNDGVCFSIMEDYSIDANQPRLLKLGIKCAMVLSSDITDSRLIKTTHPSRGAVMPAIKGMMVTADMMNNKESVTAINSAALQYFHYECKRQRGDNGYPFGATLASCLDFVLKVSSSDTGRVFYENLSVNEPMVLSILFDSSFTGKKSLTDFQNALVVRGYVVDIDESFDKNPIRGDGRFNMMMLHIRLLMSELRYVGSPSMDGVSSLLISIASD